MTAFPELNNSYREPEPEPPEASFVEEVAVFVVLGSIDYEGSYIPEGPFVFTSEAAAERRVTQLRASSDDSFTDDWPIHETTAYSLRSP